ncbi:Uncharacterised protein [Comamonas terrigena]|nr:Uncharacterised protein [Comamonas terrigena]
MQSQTGNLFQSEFARKQHQLPSGEFRIMTEMLT